MTRSHRDGSKTSVSAQMSNVLRRWYLVLLGTETWSPAHSGNESSWRATKYATSDKPLTEPPRTMGSSASSAVKPLVRSPS